MRRLCAGETVDGTKIAPVPPEPLEVWIGGHAPAAVDRAARLGDGWLAGPEATPEHARALVTTYLERCAAVGRIPTAVAIRRDVHVGADDADAERVAGPVLARGYRGFDPSACVVGGPERVAEQFRELATMGYTDVIVRHLADEQAEVLASFAAGRRAGRDTRRMIAAFSVTPLGITDSVGDLVADAVRVVRDSGLPSETNAMFTNLEGEWDQVMGVIKAAVDVVAASAAGERRHQDRSPPRRRRRNARKSRVDRASSALTALRCARPGSRTSR